MILVLDYVTNHWGLEHWIIKDLSTPNWINQFDRYTLTNHKRSTIHDTNTSKIDTETFLNCWFVPTMTNLNLQNPLTLKYLKEIIFDHITLNYIHNCSNNFMNKKRNSKSIFNAIKVFSCISTKPK
jgi:glycosidase